MDHASRKEEGEASASVALLASEELNRRILEAVPAGVVHVGADGAILRANSEALRILGLSYEELTGRYTADFSTETVFEDGSTCSHDAYPVTRALRTGQPQPAMVIGVSRRNAERVWALFTAVPVLHPSDGSVTGSVVTFLDITARKEIEAALRASEAQLRSVLLSAPNIILTVDREGTILFINRVVAPFRREDVLGSEVYHYLPEQERPRVRALLADVLRTGQVASFETPLRRDLSEKIYAATMGPVRVDDAIVGATVLTWDVTEQRALQARLAVSDRMASVGTLAAGVAHEINNPLTYVAGNLEWLERQVARGNLDLEQLRSALMGAIEGTDRIRTIVRDLATFSHAGEPPATLLDVGPLLDSALRMAQGELRCRAKVVRNYGAVPRVRATEARLGQVFLNLIVNAAQAIPEGQAEINEVAISTFTGSRGEVVIEIRDTGAGMAEAVRARAFEPFVTTKLRGEGTGLGLYICRNIVVALGGEITLTSAPDAGTTVRLTLPGDVGTGAAPTAPSSPNASAGEPLRILIIDDEPNIVRVLEHILEGHQVQTASSGSEALRLLVATEFDLVLCDLVMPDLTGMDVYEQLGAIAPERAQRIIFMTGGAFTGRSRAFLERRGARVLEKPFAASTVERLVREARHR